MVRYFRFSLPADQVVRLPAGASLPRARAILIGDEIFTKVGGHILGIFLTSVSTGTGTAAAALRLLPRGAVLRRLDTC